MRPKICESCQSGSCQDECTAEQTCCSNSDGSVRDCCSSCQVCDEGTCVDMVTEIKSIKFTSDHGDLKDNNEDWTDSGETYTEPEWVKGSTNNPISHTKNTKITINVKVNVSSSGVKFNLIGDGPNNYVDFSKTGITSTGSDQTITITANDELPNQIDTLSKSISWTIKLTDSPSCEWSVGTSGPHKIYVTYGTPDPAGGVVTEKRMGWACGGASGAITAKDVADEIHVALSGDPPEDGHDPIQTDDWQTGLLVN